MTEEREVCDYCGHIRVWHGGKTHRGHCHFWDGVHECRCMKFESKVVASRRTLRKKGGKG